MKFRNCLGFGILVCGLTAADSADAHFPCRRYCVQQCRAAHAPPHAVRAPLYGPMAAPAAILPGCDPCNPCPQPMIAPQPIYQTQMRPVAEMTLQPRQVLTYQTVPQIQYQRQAVIENVPITTYQNVTVDEGSYQTVWVPRPVTKSVAQTVLQPQTRYQDVAVQVQQQVAQIQTQLVPQQTVRYVPETRMVGLQPAGAPMIGWQPGGSPTYAGAIGTPYAPIAPMTAGLPGFTLPGEPVPTLASPILIPGGDYMSAPTAAEWSTIQQRQSAAPAGDSPQAAAAPSPTAATVWQSQLHTGQVAR